MRLRPALRAIARRTPVLGTVLDRSNQALSRTAALLSERSTLVEQLAAAQRETEQRGHAAGFVPPGHFYSPIPDFAAVDRDAPLLFPNPPPRTLPGIDLRETEQLDLIERLAPLYAEMPFTAGAQPGLRYRFENGAYSYADGIFLYLVLRHLRPRRIIEIGSGHSSCAMLDTIERFLPDPVEVTFIEPYPELLHSLLHQGDTERVTILPTKLQDVPAETFASLGQNDILFIDSTHVGKIGSDVARLFNDILPALRPGVRVHVHDIFYPFEYPHFWFVEGRAWNEAYLLRAFLQFNQRFDIELWNHFLLTFHHEFFAAHLPLCLTNPGASIWLRVRA